MIIAQLSDIHASPNNANLARFEHALAWLETVGPDILVLTGDLIDDGWHEGYSTIAHLLNRLTYPVLILPGNADDREAMKRTWNGMWVSDAPAGALNVIMDTGELRLIGIDTTLVGNAAGSLRHQLNWLENALTTGNATDSVIFMHHHVFASGIPTMDEIMCGGSAELADMLTRLPHKPLAIATGHVHRPMAGSFAGIPAYICGSVCPANPLWFGGDKVPPVNDPAMLTIHRFRDGVLVSHTVSV